MGGAGIRRESRDLTTDEVPARAWESSETDDPFAEAAGQEAEEFALRLGRQRGEAADTSEPNARGEVPRLGEGGRPGWAEYSHVFNGEVKDGNSLKGYHYREGGYDRGAERFDDGTRYEGPSGCYGGDWRMLDANGNVLRSPGGNELVKTTSRFFPDEWSRDDVEAAVAEAHDDALSRGAVDEDGFKGDARGLTIQAWFAKDTRDITTAYPVFAKCGTKG